MIKESASEDEIRWIEKELEGFSIVLQGAAVQAEGKGTQVSYEEALQTILDLFKGGDN